MLNTDVKIPNSDALTAEVVADYLRKHPYFFLERPELVEQLSLPAPDGTISLAHLQMKRQRERIEALEEEVTGLMSLSASNDRIFFGLMAIQEKMLACKCVAQAVQVLAEQSQHMNLQLYIRLQRPCVASMMLNEAAWQKFLKSHLNGQSVYLGRLKRVDRIGLLGSDEFSPEFGSYIILPLALKQSGFLAFSSEDGGHFQPTMDTLFVRHLAALLSHLILTLPWDSES